MALPLCSCGGPSPVPPSPTPVPLTYSAVKVQGLNSRDVKAFGREMVVQGIKPIISCKSTYCDIGTREHVLAEANIVFLTGHGYVENGEGQLYCSGVEQESLFVFKREDGYDMGEYIPYKDVVLAHQQNATDWLALAACNQLRRDTREGVLAAMEADSGHPLKGVLAYGNYSGTERDDLIMTKFARLCGSGVGVANAWFAAHEICDPFLAIRTMAALREGHQNDALTDSPAQNAPLCLRQIGEAAYHDVTAATPERLAVEIPLGGPSVLTVEKIEIPDDKANDPLAFAAASLPGDFVRYKTNFISESGAQGDYAATVGGIYSYVRRIEGIRVAETAQNGEYACIILTGDKTADVIMEIRAPGAIDTVGLEKTARNTLISREEAMDIGLEALRVKRELEEPPQFNAAEMIYALHPQDRRKLALCWKITDVDYIYAVLAADSGEVLYYSE